MDRLANSIIIVFIGYKKAVGRHTVELLILSEQDYYKQMENIVEPYLAVRKSVLWPERNEGKKYTVSDIWRTVRKAW